MIDIERVRQETPGCKNVVHFNNAGSSLVPQVVIDAVQDYLQLELLNGGYEAEELRSADIERFYESTAKLINCSPGEIAFIENATRAWDMAFYSLDLREGDEILTAVAEYASNYIAFLQLRKRRGVHISVVPNDESGQLSVDALRGMITPRTKLIAITHVPTNGGLTNPATAIGKIAREAGVTYLLDACQSIGQMPVDVEAIGCDILSCTGRKFLRGPRGTGFLYVRSDLCKKMEPVFLDLHAAQWSSRDEYIVREDARRFETWECNYAAKLGLDVAIRYALDLGLDHIEARVSPLANLLRERLSRIEGVSVHDIGERKNGIVTFSIQDKEPESVRIYLRDRRINVSTSSVKGTRLDMEQRNLTAFVRSSVHYYNTEAEVDQLCEALSAIPT